VRLQSAVDLLKQCKTEGLKYHDATQVLMKQGFSQEEIEHASYEFPYSDAESPNPGDIVPRDASDQSFAKAVIREKAIDSKKRNLYKDIVLGLFGGRSIVGRYYGTKTISDYAALKDLEANTLDGSSQNGTRVFQRHRVVRYYAILALLPLIFLVPYFVGLMLHAIPILLQGRNHASLVTTSLLLWSALGSAAYIYIVCLLFFARKEATIVRSIYVMMGLETVAFVLAAIVARSSFWIVVGAATLIPGYWISSRVGLLSAIKAEK